MYGIYVDKQIKADLLDALNSYEEGKYSSVQEAIIKELKFIAFMKLFDVSKLYEYINSLDENILNTDLIGVAETLSVFKSIGTNEE